MKYYRWGFKKAAKNGCTYKNIDDLLWYYAKQDDDGIVYVWDITSGKWVKEYYNNKEALHILKQYCIKATKKEIFLDCL
jgi:ABC-type ATPase with predicted acetyltransferase domain